MSSSYDYNFKLILDFDEISNNLATLFEYGNIGGKAIGTLAIGEPVELKKGFVMVGLFPLYWKLELGLELNLELGADLTGNIGFGSSGGYEAEMGMMYCAHGFTDEDCKDSSDYGLNPINKLEVSLPNFKNVGKGLDLKEGKRVATPKLIPTFVFTLTLWEMFSFLFNVHLIVAVEIMNPNTDAGIPTVPTGAESTLGYWKFNIRSFKNVGNRYPGYLVDRPIYPGFRIEAQVPKDARDPRIGTDLGSSVEYVAKKWQSGCMYKKVGDKEYSIEHLGNQAVLQGPINGYSVSDDDYQFVKAEECPDRTIDQNSNGIYCPKYIGFDYETTASSTQERRCKGCGTLFNAQPYGFQDILIGPTDKSETKHVDFLFFQDCRPNHLSDSATEKYTLTMNTNTDTGTNILTKPYSSSNRCANTYSDFSNQCEDDCCSTGDNGKGIKTELRVDYEWIPMSKMEEESSATLGSSADMADFNTVSDLKSLKCTNEEFTYRTSLQLGVSVGFEVDLLAAINDADIVTAIFDIEQFVGKPILGFELATDILPITSRMVLPFLTGCFNHNKFDLGWHKSFRMFMCPPTSSGRRRRLGNGYCVMDPSAGLQIVH